MHEPYSYPSQQKKQLMFLVWLPLFSCGLSRLNSLSLITAIVALSDGNEDNRALETKLGMCFDAFDFGNRGSLNLDEVVSKT